MTGIRNARRAGQCAGLPASPLFDALGAISSRVRSMKFCAGTAHTGVTEKYDGGAAHTACGRFWEAA
ncbi:hypothetical protein GCM10010344_21030 [Streptomyces bluensis]|nr:hypothetical protein GCM10010344_21030 [Streptomyces bluensis]